MPRCFFFGMIEVPMWDYYWGLTAAQVELLTIDQPIIVYKADETKVKPWESGHVSAEYANKQYEKWLKNKKEREKSGRKTDFGKIFNGKKVDFDEFLRTGEKKER